jgi:predicted TIM-barrel fold metal-dependent hydrolase
MYGTDFPNLPYAWDREIKRLVRQNLSQDSLAKVLGQNAVEFYQIDPNECGRRKKIEGKKMRR